MKFIYACDIHGDKNKYEKLLEEAISKDIKYLVFGGDLYPKRGIRNIIQPEFLDNYFEDYFKRLKENNIECILIPGNDDKEIFDEILNSFCEKYPNIHNIDETRFDVEDVSFIGLSKVLDHPFGSKNRVIIEENLGMQKQIAPVLYINKNDDTIFAEDWEEYRKTHCEKMEDVLDRLPKVEENRKAIYILHCPPYGVGLDECKSGDIVGSKAIVSFLKETNAYMSFHGHIHESPKMSGKWFAEIGNTISIQPGQTEKDEKDIIFVLIDTESGEKERIIKDI